VPDTLLRVSALRAALVALSAAVLTAACAAGQHAQTAEEKPTIDGTQGSVGAIQLESVALHTPPNSSYPAGASVPMSVYIANTGNTADTLTNVTSTAFTGWGVVASSSGQTSSAAASPATSAAGSAPGTPQRIGAGGALSLGLQKLTSNGTGSPQTLVLQGLASKSAPLYPGSAVKITFTFAKAGQTTLTVPVQLSVTPNQQTLAPGTSPPPPSPTPSG
jgi:copper(I)-binding protein